MPFSLFIDNRLLTHLTRKGTWTRPGAVYSSLHVSPGPGKDGQTGNEVSGGSYARKQVSHADWAAPATSSTNNANEIKFVTATGSWGTVSHVGLWDHLTQTSASHFIGFKALDTPKAVNNGDVAKFVAGALKILMAGTA
jgi:hypothetical protein